jgi:hypothetical protein
MISFIPLAPRVLTRLDELLHEVVEPAIDVAVLRVEDELPRDVLCARSGVELADQGLVKHLNPRDLG